MADGTARTTSSQRDFLNALLSSFDKSWTSESLDEIVRGIPRDDESFRLLALVELVKVDLKHNWLSGRELAVEDYLVRLPDLGTAEAVPPELVYSEYEVRRQCGKPVELAELERRFPNRIEQIRRWIGSADEATVSYSPSEANTLAFPAGTLDEFATRAPVAAESRPPDFGRYRIVRQLGAGAMGAVYLAHDTQLDRQVALKTPSFGGHPDLDAIQRFYREARLAATLRHPNICPIHDVGEIDGVHFITMAYIEGRPLSEYIRPDKPIPLHGAAMAVRKLALALQHAHENGVIHRDLKPANIMVDKSREPIVMDFGLARRADTADQTLKTQTGMILGTPSYMSPEQVEGDPDKIGRDTDQYSLGVILYELITSQRPFQGSLMALIGKIATQPPPPPSEVRTDVDPALESICLKMMSKRPQDRYVSLKEAAEALGAYLKSSVNAPTETTAEPPPSETELSEADLPEAAASTGSEADTPSAKRAAKAAGEELQEFLALQSLERKIPPRVAGPPHPALSARSRRKPALSPAVKWTFIGVPLAVVVLLSADLIFRAARGPRPHSVGASSTGQTNPAAASSKTTAQASTPKVYGTNEWIDVIPLVDPESDRQHYRSTRANEWTKKDDELTFISDGKVGRLLFPLILQGRSLEWEIEFTRLLGIGRFSTHIPAATGFVGVDLGREDGRYKQKAVLGGNLEEDAAWSAPCDVVNGQRRKIKIRAERIGATDRVEIFVDGRSRGVWNGDRESITRFPVTEYRTDERIGLWVSPGGEYTFHSIRLRMLEGSARLIDRPPAKPLSSWVEVLPQIAPERDKLDKLGGDDACEWRMEADELVVRSKGRDGKLVFPLLFDGPSLEWEIDFTRNSGDGGFASDIPAFAGYVPVLIGGPEQFLRLGKDKRFQLLTKWRIANGKRMKLRVMVTRAVDGDGKDFIELFVNDERVGNWRGDRNELAYSTQPDDDFPTHERNGLWIQPNTSFTFHGIRVRALDGEARQSPYMPTPPPPGEWTELFNGRDLSGWRQHAGGRWRVENGAIMVDENGTGTLISDQQFKDFELTLEVLADRQGNGGVWFHLPPNAQRPEQSYELQVAGSDGDFGKNHTGGIYESMTIVARVNPPVAPDGQWVPLRLMVSGTRIQSWVDGRLVADIQGKAERMPGGHLGLQGRRQEPGVRVGYRNIRVRRLPDRGR